MATFETEIRKLQATELCTLAQYLNESDYWKKLMAIIQDDEHENVSLFTPDNFRMIEQAIQQQKRSGAEIFLSEWSTIGKFRPNCKLLLDLLVKLDFFKAADYLAVEVLKIDAPERPKHGPAAVIDISDEMLEKMLREQACLDTQSENDLTCSISCIGKPAEVIPVHAEKVQQEVELSDMIKFSVDRSDMMKFSKTVDDIKKLPEEVFNVMKYGIDNDADKYEDNGLQVVESDNIPLCVNNSGDIYSNNNNKANYSITSNSTMSSSSFSDSDSTQTTASERDIPIAVLKCNDRSNKNT